MEGSTSIIDMDNLSFYIDSATPSSTLLRDFTLDLDNLRSFNVDDFSSTYTILSPLGEGGYGSVYLCQDIYTRSLLAVKIIPDSKCSAKMWCPARQDYVPNEVALWEGLQHNNLLSLKDVYYERDQWLLVMEYNSGYEDLYDHIARVGRLSSEDTANVIQQVIDVVFYLCCRGIDHRDIKDENILYNPVTKHVKIIDFGSSTPLSSSAYVKFAGTAVYVPPEFFTKGSYHSFPASVWSIGCLAFILLNGERPFKDREEVKRYQGGLKWMRAVDEVARDFISCCLTVEPSARMPLCDIMAHPFLFEFNFK